MIKFLMDRIQEEPNGYTLVLHKDAHDIHTDAILIQLGIILANRMLDCIDDSDVILELPFEGLNRHAIIGLKKGESDAFAIGIGKTENPTASIRARVTVQRADDSGIKSLTV